MNVMDSRSRSGHAIVIGASIAGLLATRVLAEHFRRVTLIDRDTLPDVPVHRKAIPQGAHAHGVLARGLAVMTRLFPDLLAALVEGGAVHLDFSALAFYQFGVWKQRSRPGIDGVMVTRPFLEWHVRRRVVALPNVTVLAEHRVAALVTADGHRRVTGVCVTRPGGQNVTLEGDLVVDASGRGSRTPEMLAALGLGRPGESAVEVDLAYTTRLYRRRGLPDSWKGLLVMPKPPQERRLGVLLAVENDRWICTLGGWHGDHAPTDEAGYLAFARSLPVRDLYDVVSEAEPVSPIAVHKIPSSLRRHYERMALPEGFVVIGDALCSFNPVYGQGMTVSALQAERLEAWLCERHATGRADGTGRLQRSLATAVENPWLLAAGEDLRWPETQGPRSVPTSLVNAYVAHVHRAAGIDDGVATAFYRVMHMLDEPATLFQPGRILRVLARSVLGGRRRVGEGVEGPGRPGRLAPPAISCRTSS
jgi:2-polyprenyl-6-methoxyphenol hydroxylase-like FAD-dependent oxidoreductase